MNVGVSPRWFQRFAGGLQDRRPARGRQGGSRGLQEVCTIVERRGVGKAGKGSGEQWRRRTGRLLEGQRTSAGPTSMAREVAKVVPEVCRRFAGSSTSQGSGKLAKEAVSSGDVGQGACWKARGHRSGQQARGRRSRFDAFLSAGQSSPVAGSRSCVDAAVAGQAGALNGKAGGNDHKGNMSANSAARAFIRRTPARNAST